jgi:hypothetical protein
MFRVDDSTTPLDIPTDAEVALYFDGDFATTPEVAARFKRVRWITVLANWRECGIQDLLEQTYFRPSLMRAFVRGRSHINEKARIYVDRDQAREAIRSLYDFGHSPQLLRYPGLEWWISTLDNEQWTPDELAQDLAQNWDAPEIKADKIWANQNTPAQPGQHYDGSNLFLPF